MNEDEDEDDDEVAVEDEDEDEDDDDDAWRFVGDAKVIEGKSSCCDCNGLFPRIMPINIIIICIFC